MIRRIPEENLHQDEVKEIWNKLIMKNNNYDIGQQYDYVVHWWKFYRNEVVQKELLLLLFKSSDNTSILWPLMIRNMNYFKGIHVIGQIDGYMTDYAIPLVENPNSFEKSLFEFVKELQEFKWDYLKVNIPNWAGLLKLNTINDSYFKSNKIHWSTKKYDDYTYINLNTDFDSYISKLGSRTRTDVKKYLRNIEIHNFNFRIAEGNELKELIPELIKINKKTWTIFSNQNSSEEGFLNSLIEKEFNPEYGKIIMPVLEYEGNLVASVLGYICGNKCYLHVAGIQRMKIKNISPGITLYALLIRELFKLNIEVLDLSPGLEDYKFRLNAKKDEIIQIVIFKNKLTKLKYCIVLNIVNFLKSIKAKLKKAI